MAWAATTEQLTGRTGKYYEETISLVDTAKAYTAEIDFVGPDPSREFKYVLVEIVASAVTGTNLDVALEGAVRKSGTLTVLLDAIVADITDTTPALARLDLNEYSAMVYKFSFLSDTDETANSVTVRVWIPT